MIIAFEVDDSYVCGSCVSAAEAARRLNISAGRITQFMTEGILAGYRDGRSTFVSEESIEKRLDSPVKSGRPKERQNAPIIDFEVARNGNKAKPIDWKEEM